MPPVVKCMFICLVNDGFIHNLNLFDFISFHLIDRFYASTLPNHPEVQHIMKMSISHKNDPVCLTCFLGNSCRYNDAHFNSIATSFVLECKGYEIPRVELRNAENNQLIETLVQNTKLYQFLRDKHIPRYEKIYVRLSDNEGIIYIYYILYI